MNQEYTLMGLISLAPGSWADWFSGTMSALAIVVALAAYPITTRQRRKSDRAADVEVGRRIGWKMITLLNQNGDIERHITESLALREPTYPPDMKFPLVRPLGVPERKPQDLNQNEVDLLLKTQSADLLLELELCYGRFSSIVYAMTEYKARHEALYEIMPQPVASDGMTFTHRLSPEEASRVMPYAMMLESLLESMVLLVGLNAVKLQACLKHYDQDMTRHFGKSLMTFEAADEGEEKPT